MLSKCDLGITSNEKKSIRCLFHPRYRNQTRHQNLICINELIPEEGDLSLVGKSEQAVSNLNVDF